MKTRLLLPVAVLFAACLLPSVLLAQATTVPFPRDQIALQVGAIQMGYATNGAPFTPADQQKAANALAQGRIALATATDWGSANVVGAIQPADYGAQLDTAVQAVIAAPVNSNIKGKATLSDGKVKPVTAKRREWIVCTASQPITLRRTTFTENWLPNTGLKLE
jgi:hypothetical protein